MFDFAAARRMMVDGQVRTADVNEPRLLAALSDIPREMFLPGHQAELAYLDRDLRVGGEGAPARHLLKPMVLAKLIQAAEIAETDAVLDVGCATGYSTAVLSRMALSVVGLEEDGTLAKSATEALARNGIRNAEIVSGPLIAGWPDRQPYDVIVVQGAVEVLPESLSGQLKEGGRLVCVFGRSPAGKATVCRMIDGALSERPIFDASAAMLPGFEKPPAFVF